MVEPGVAARGRRGAAGDVARRRRRARLRPTSRSSRRSATLRRIRSPLRTRPSGPPTAASGRDVQHDRAERGAAHARIRDPDHVLDAGARELAGDRQVARLRHAGAARRAGVLQHQHVVRRDVEVRIVDPRREILEALNTTARPSCSNSRASAAERFRIAPPGASQPNSATSPPTSEDRLGERPHHAAIDVVRLAVEALAQASRR